MSHVDGVDDGVGYGVYGKTATNVGVVGESDSGYGIYGLSNSRDGVVGFGPHGSGVRGQSNDGHGVIGTSNSGFGVHGVSIGEAGVVGEGVGDISAGVVGISYNGGAGMVAVSRKKGGVGLVATGVPDGIGLIARGENDHAVLARSDSGDGVQGFSRSGNGVFGQSNRSTGVKGESLSGLGVYGTSDDSAGVYGRSRNSVGVEGDALDGIGVYCYSHSGSGLYAISDLSYAAYLDGSVYIRGPLQKPGGQFKIDHPLDPANKYLSHSFVESPDMKNVYDGVITLDKKGEAEVELPDWFSALNKDYRYQLTAIGAPGPNLYIAKEIIETGAEYANPTNNINNNHSSFRIAGGTSGMKVSWQVTGIRKDPWANAHRIEVEEDKPDKEREYYIYPELYGQPADKGIGCLLIPEELKVPVVTKNR